MFTISDKFKLAFDKASVRPGVIVAITGATRLKAPNLASNVNLFWRSYTATEGAGAYASYQCDPIIEEVSDLATSMGPIDRELTVGQTSLTLSNSQAVRDILTTYQIVGRTIEFYIYSPDMDLWTADAVPYWSGEISEVIPEETQIEIVCSSRMDPLVGTPCYSKIVNMHVLEACENVMGDAGLVKDGINGWDSTSFDFNHADNEYFYHYTANNVQLSKYFESRRFTNGAPVEDKAPRWGPFYGQGEAVGDVLPGPGVADVDSKKALQSLIRHTNGCLRIGNTGKLSFVPWDTSAGYVRTFSEEEYSDFEVVSVFEDSIINSYLIQLGDGDSAGIIKIKDDASITRWGSERSETYAPDSGVSKAVAGDTLYNPAYGAGWRDLGNIDDASDWETNRRDIYDNQIGSWLNPGGRGTEDKWAHSWQPSLGQLYGGDIMGFAGSWGFNDLQQPDSDFANRRTRPNSQKYRYGCLTTARPGWWYIPARRDVWKVTQGPLGARLDNDWLRLADIGTLTGFSAYDDLGDDYKPIPSAYYEDWNGVTGEPNTMATIVTVGSTTTTVDLPLAKKCWAALEVSAIYWDMTAGQPYLNPSTWVNTPVQSESSTYSPIVGGQLGVTPIYTGITYEDASSTTVHYGKAWILTDNDYLGGIPEWLTSHTELLTRPQVLNNQHVDASETENAVIDFTQVKDYVDRLLDRTANGVPVIRFKTSLRHIDLELGDIVRVYNSSIFLWSEKRIENCNWEIISKTVTPIGGDAGIVFELAFSSFYTLPFPKNVITVTVLGNGIVGSTSLGESIRRALGNRMPRGIPRIVTPPILQKLQRSSDNTDILHIGAIRFNGGAADFPGGLMEWPPSDRPSNTSVKVWYAVDLKSGSIASAMTPVSGLDQEVTPFPTTTFVTIASVGCNSNGTMGDIEPYTQYGGYLDSATSQGLDHTYPNYNFSQWHGGGSGGQFPMGWRLLSSSRTPLETHYTTASPKVGTVSTAEVAAAIIAPTKKTRKGGLFALGLSGIPTMTFAGRYTSYYYKYPDKLMLQGPLIACETGIPYTFNIVAQSEASGTNFDLNIVLYNEDGTFNNSQKASSASFKSANTWEILTVSATPSATQKFLGIEFEITGRNKNRTIIDSIRMVKNLPEYSHYNFTAYKSSAQPVSYYGYTSDITWTLLHNSHAYDETGTVSTWQNSKTWVSPKSGYYRVRARLLIKQLSDAQSGGYSASGQNTSIISIQKLDENGANGVIQASSFPIIYGNSYYSATVSKQASFDTERVLYVAEGHQIRILVKNNDSATFDISGASGIAGQEVSALEISAVEIV